MKIRQANFKDLEAISIIFDEYRQFYKQNSDITSAKLFLRNRFEHLQSIFFICEEGDRILGFTHLYPVFSSISMKRSYILNDLFVRPEHRKKHIAKQLIAEAKEYVRFMDGKGLELSTAKDNDPAQSLYKSENFHKEEDFITFFWSKS
ncbi:GNAT family N-acetyltransferase [Leptospira sp. 96542]|nr:GNAT family N-acetyltransferase [Leptospira sp. 96542]